MSDSTHARAHSRTHAVQPYAHFARYTRRKEETHTCGTVRMVRKKKGVESEGTP